MPYKQGRTIHASLIRIIVSDNMFVDVVARRCVIVISAMMLIFHGFYKRRLW